MASDAHPQPRRHGTGRGLPGRRAPLPCVGDPVVGARLASDCEGTQHAEHEPHPVACASGPLNLPQGRGIDDPLGCRETGSDGAAACWLGRWPLQFDAPGPRPDGRSRNTLARDPFYPGRPVPIPGDGSTAASFGRGACLLFAALPTASRRARCPTVASIERDLNAPRYCCFA